MFEDLPKLARKIVSTTPLVPQKKGANREDVSKCCRCSNVHNLNYAQDTRRVFRQLIVKLAIRRWRQSARLAESATGRSSSQRTIPTRHVVDGPARCILKK